MAMVAEEALRTIHPDLILIGVSNIGGAPFLRGAPVEPYFDRDPRLWLRLFPPSYLARPCRPGLDAKVALLHRVRLYRFALLGIMAATGDDRTWVPENDDAENVAAVRRFVTRHKGEVRIAFFLCPGCRKEPEAKERYYRGLDVPVLALSAAGRADEFGDIHPPAAVMSWYAENIADWLVRERLVP